MTTAKLIGADDVSGSNESAGFWLVNRFQAVTTGRITEFRVKAGASSQVKVAIYADSSGSPGARLSYNDTAQNVVAGWNTLSIPSLDITSGTYYWLAIVTGGAGAGQWKDQGETAVYKYKAITFSTFTFPDPAGTGFSATYGRDLVAGWGVLVLSPSGLSQPIAYGTPTVEVGEEPVGLTIYPPGLQVVMAYGTPALRYPQTISPSGLNVPIAYGTPSIVIVGEGVIYVPGHQQPIGYGTPIILKYVWHVILDGQYNIESPAVNRAYVIGRDVYDNPVYGEAHDSGESGLLGERLDFQQELAIPTTAQAGDVAAAILSKMRLNKARGVILIPPNCGQELWDVVQITDAGANQSAVKFRVVGIRFEYNPKQARYEHKLILGAP
jgi:hypothetical protein